MLIPRRCLATMIYLVLLCSIRWFQCSLNCARCSLNGFKCSVHGATANRLQRTVEVVLIGVAFLMVPFSWLLCLLQSLHWLVLGLNVKLIQIYQSQIGNQLMRQFDETTTCTRKWWPKRQCRWWVWYCIRGQYFEQYSMSNVHSYTVEYTVKRVVTVGITTWTVGELCLTQRPKRYVNSLSQQ
jgi:hypothetical protein